MKDQSPDWKVQTNYWNVEDTQKWRTEDTDNFFLRNRGKEKMIGGCYELQIHSNTDSFVMHTSFFYGTTIGGKRYICLNQLDE